MATGLEAMGFAANLIAPEHKLVGLIIKGMGKEAFGSCSAGLMALCKASFTANGSAHCINGAFLTDAVVDTSGTAWQTEHETHAQQGLQKVGK